MLMETAAAAVAGLTAYSWLIEPRWCRIRRHTIHLPGCPMRPLRILHLSDFHFYRGSQYRKRFLARLAGEPVDLIFITGDLIDNDGGIDLCLEALRPLRAPHGIYATLGNHDYMHVKWRNLIHRTGAVIDEKGRTPNDVDRLVRGLRDLGIVVLRNQRAEVTIEGVPVTIAGVDDPYTRHDDIEATFQGFVKQGPCLALIHSPCKYDKLTGRGVDMVFSGHTHGGQVCVPFFGPLITRTHAPRKMAYGLNRLNGTVYYTTRGLGSSPLTYPRFNCRPEVNFFELHFGNSQHGGEDGAIAPRD